MQIPLQTPIRARKILAATVLNLVAILPLSANAGAVSVSTGNEYKGWQDAIIMSNGKVEVVVVPSIGRVMQMRFAGETDGPFWLNDTLAGKHMGTSPWNVSQGSYGGDKSWPSPQSVWSWPPPIAFDNSPYTAEVLTDNSLLLTSPICKDYGIQVLRKITLEPDACTMHIQTTYKKMQGDPVEFSVWIITQAKPAKALYIDLPADSIFPQGYYKAQTDPVGYLTKENSLLRLTRNPDKNVKIGNDGSRIVWVGEKELLCLGVERATGTYPENGCSVAVYTNAGPTNYVELETMGLLKSMKAGDANSDTTTYTLARRTNAGEIADVNAVMNR